MGTTALLPLLAVAFVVSSAFGDFDVPTTADYYPPPPYNSSGAPKWNVSAVDYTTPVPGPYGITDLEDTSETVRPPLSDSGNYYRQILCGRKFNDNTKPGQDTGRELAGAQAPWLFGITYGIGLHDVDYATGFAISGFHLLTSIDVVMKRGSSNDTLEWQASGEAVDMTQCKNRTMLIPRNFVRIMRAFRCGNLVRGADCIESQPSNGPVRGHYIGDCDHSGNGLIVLEAFEHFDPKFVHPLCLPEHPETLLGKNLTVYSIGKLSSNGTILKDTLRTAQCDSEDHNNVCTHDSSCMDTFGAPLTTFGNPSDKFKRNQQFAWAVTTEEECGNDISKHVSVAEFFPEISRLTGIRNVKNRSQKH